MLPVSDGAPSFGDCWPWVDDSDVIDPVDRVLEGGAQRHRLLRCRYLDARSLLRPLGRVRRVRKKGRKPRVRIGFREFRFGKLRELSR